MKRSIFIVAALILGVSYVYNRFVYHGSGLKTQVIMVDTVRPQLPRYPYPALVQTMGEGDFVDTGQTGIMLQHMRFYKISVTKIRPLFQPAPVIVSAILLPEPDPNNHE